MRSVSASGDASDSACGKGIRQMHLANASALRAREVRAARAFDERV